MTYQDLFEMLGRPLKAGDAIPPKELARAERRLRCRVPDALRAFYDVAVRATDFIDHHDHFLAPGDWSIEAGKLMFLTENQAVVLYAVDATVPSKDPPVFMANNSEPYAWHPACDRCSEFLQVMLCWEGAFGGAMKTGGSVVVPAGLRGKLEAKFQRVGEVNGMSGYVRTGAVVCFVKWNGGWRIFSGATNVTILAKIETDLGVKLE